MSLFRNAEKPVLDAISRSMAVIEFDPTGTILSANENFCKGLGYSLAEIQGKHHRMFCDAGYAASPDYAEFWKKLNSGEFVSGDFQRFKKDRSPVWMQASYNPVLDSSGKVIKVVKLATDSSSRLPVERIGAALKMLADCDLTSEIKENLPPAYQEMRNSFNAAITQLLALIRDISSISEVVARSSGETKAAADDFSKRTEQQAAGVEETAAALSEMTGAVKQSASDAADVRVAASKTKDLVSKSEDVMKAAVNAMEEISKSSNQVSQIVNLIDDIAFQTNLLALNAGVEAARAGDAGRGFAVVASEVRALAQRSASAAKDIKQLISESSGQVKRGVDLVGNASMNLEKIITEVASVDELIDKIASAASRQATGLSEINSTVNHMDQATQQNAAMIEESNASATSLNYEAERLLTLVKRFKLDGATVSRPTAVAPLSSSVKPAKAMPIKQQQQKLAHALKAGGALVKDDEWQEF